MAKLIYRSYQHLVLVVIRQRGSKLRDKKPKIQKRITLGHEAIGGRKCRHDLL